MRQVHEIESVFMSGHSHLEVICGPMFCGKTEELIRRIRRVEYAGLRSVVFKPELDVRFSKNLVVSHSDQKIQSKPVASISCAREYLVSLEKKPHVVGFDEAQFFEHDVIDLCEELVGKGMRVIAAGLCEDYLGKPFGPMPDILAHADSVTKLWAICMKCGAPASKTQRLAKDGDILNENQVMIGAGHCYEARCRSCHQKSVIRQIEEGVKSEAVDLV